MNEYNFSIPTMLSLKQASMETGLSYDFLRKLCLCNKVVHVRAGTKFLVNMEKLVAYLNSGDEDTLTEPT